MPFFSVIIPLYNKENYIEATLKSVLAQTFIDFEIIIINDVSTDNSLAAAQFIKDSRIRIITHEVNKGLSASRNTGIREAKSDYIAFLDADDLWKPGFLEAIHKLIIQYPEIYLFATKYEEKHSLNITLPIEISGVKLNDNESYILNFFPTNMGKLLVSFASLCVKKSLFNKIGTFDESITYAEDIDFYIRAFFNNEFAYHNTSLASYMIYDSQQMSLAGLKNKTIPDFGKYEYMTENRTDIKLFLDFYRYIMAKQYKLAGDVTNYKKMLKGIDISSLNYKQIILLYSPVFVLKLIKKLKAKLIKKGINPTTY
jgi:glycosyltransferase involved in cell wall biosynthesis